jgi:DNA topoisomerase-2
MSKKVQLSDASKYDKKTPREHVLIRPDTYIGDIEPTTEDMWIYKDGKIIKEKITYTPGFLKIFDEIIVNARDASVNDDSCDTIKIEYNKEEGYISVYNNGDKGIPVEEHPEHKMLVPSMIFGELLTSSNYNDDEKRITGGRNGYGAKLANIFSKEFTVEVMDAKRHKKFVQSWKDNMSVIEKAKVTDNKGSKSHVKITFYPDFTKFKMEDLNNDHYELFHRRVIDIAGVTEGKLKVYFNEDKIEANNFKQYVELYYPGEEIFYDIDKRWGIGCLYKQDTGGEVISFVNGISTYRGGSHCSHVIDNIIKVLINDYIKKKDKDIKVTPSLLKENLIFFINATVENPAFSSQTKDTLTTKIEKFGSKYEPTQVFLKKIAKCGIVEQVIQLIKFKENSNLKKTDGKKQVKINGIPKLEDANKAGTKDSNKCSLILTEGDSAKAFAMAGLGIVGRDYFGVFPLKGKLLNAREATTKQLSDNDEINHLKQIIGLKHGQDYSDDAIFNQLRYGRILILTDQDVDGSHIKGLLMNFIHCIWPSLMKRNGFITSLSTPIVKATKGKDVIIFYNLSEYETWKDSDESKGYKTKYYKGLGTSTSEEAKEYFVDIEDKLINYFWNSAKKSLDIDDEIKEIDENDDAITLAFDKTRADDRKAWLMSYDKNEILKYENKKVSYREFVHLDLKHFSNDDNSRSIPSLIDGFKPSQRKILYGAALRGLDKDEVKVAQLAGFVSDKAAYHHGEASLMGAIIGMAQDFVGSNNINVLKPNGQFGTRLKGGKDAASSRYIWTMFEALTSKIFMEVDNPILNKQDDDGLPIEPETYAPIIPMILVNGTKGIGTGFSTTIPPYNPLEIIKNIKNKINKKKYEIMHPWFQGFEGIVKNKDNTTYEIYGRYEVRGNKLIVSELPIGEWSSDYKEHLEGLLQEDDKKDPKKKDKKEKKKNPFLSYIDNNSDKKVHFELEFEPDYLYNAKDIETTYHLVKRFSINNMHLYNANGAIQKYETIEDIMEDYYKVRLELYQKRKDYLLNELENQLKMISWKVKFILMIVEKKLEINNKKKSEIESQLEKQKFTKIDNSYNYLLSMPIYNLTNEKIEELKKQEKEKQTEFDTLIEKTPEKLWTTDLEILELAYNKWMEEKNKVKEKDKDLKKPKKNKK